ncbi:uncharacterized protein B0H18DRAFT_382901 [Fomitopsis serialis]|uniref:uncharacterized protein n=1 Tax=Fomitopsis serialis TaxID=139415 RepID=UPI00200732C8|nr:uncharacterized protein B0H18DRAFT_382901 [Neoantrodia serialis]KAH9925288.1 hypothetical protein B0H18DRAFT_382901 [Neoantrodia serialis]
MSLDLREVSHCVRSRCSRSLLGYETSKILHRDINIKYIMWYMRDGQIIGVLCDWTSSRNTAKVTPVIRPADGRTLPRHQSRAPANRRAIQMSLRARKIRGIAPAQVNPRPGPATTRRGLPSQVSP